MTKSPRRKQAQPHDPRLMALAEANVSSAMKELSDGLRSGTVKIITVPDSAKRKLKQSA